MAVAIGLGGCSAAAEPGASPNPILSSDLPSDVTARGVVLAAVLLREGDVERGVADGLVTPAEVDAAIAAIERDELDAWAQRAEAELAD